MLSKEERKIMIDFIVSEKGVKWIEKLEKCNDYELSAIHDKIRRSIDCH